MGDSGKSASGFLRNIVAHSGQEIDSLAPSGSDGGIDLRGSFRLQRRSRSG